MTKNYYGIVGKNINTLVENNLKPRFQYTKCSDGSVLTICVLEQGKENPIARGLAFCSPKDMFCKSVGRQISCGRAITALINKKDEYPIRRQDNLAIGTTSQVYKSQYIYGR